MADLATYKKQIQMLGSKESVNQDDLKLYIHSLADITKMMKKDASTFKILSPIAKEWIAAFKLIFGKLKSSLHSSSMTILCYSLLKAFCQFEPEHTQQLYCDWYDIISLMKSSKRADSFIKHVQIFKCIVNNLQNAEYRWEQLVILQLLHLYTKRVTSDDFSKIISKGCDDILDVFKNIINIKQQYHQTLVRANNVILNTINIKRRNILSFQPFQLTCVAVYFTTEYDLWTDFNINKMTISFVAQSLTDIYDNFYGFGSTFFLDSNERTITVKVNWSADTKRELLQSDGTEVVLRFSPPVYNSILRSKLNLLFNIASSSKLYPSQHITLHKLLKAGDASCLSRLVRRVSTKPLLAAEQTHYTEKYCQVKEQHDQNKEGTRQENFSVPLISHEKSLTSQDKLSARRLNALLSHKKPLVIYEKSIKEETTLKSYGQPLVSDEIFMVSDKKPMAVRNLMSEKKALVSYKKQPVENRVVKKKFSKTRRDLIKNSYVCSDSDTRNGNGMRPRERLKKKIIALT